MTSPFWQKTLQCRKYETYNTPRACRGFVPLQRSYSGTMRCNLVGYECVDRSDQGDCSGREKSTPDVGWLVHVTDPERPQFQQCTRAIDQRTHLKQDGVIINGTCFHVFSLCKFDFDDTGELDLPFCPMLSTCRNDSVKLVSFGENFLSFSIIMIYY